MLACLLFAVLFASLPAKAQLEELDRMFLVQVEVDKPADIALCYTTGFDKKRVKIDFAFEDTINYLADFIYEEDPMYGPDCFVPEMKLIFRQYTYVVSLYCTTAIKYKNAAPYTTSSVRMKNDLIFTQSVYQYLNRLKALYFGNKTPNKALLEKVITSDPLEEMNENVDALDEMFLDEAEVDELEVELQDEAGSNNGMFDAIEIHDDEADDPDLLDDDEETDKKPPVKNRAGGN
jgi:hypothetical protein